MAASDCSDHQASGPLTGPLLDHVKTLCERALPGQLLLLTEPALIEPELIEPVPGEACLPGAAWPARLRQQLQCSIDVSALEPVFNFSALRPRYKLCIVYIELTRLQRGDFTQCLARLKNQYCNHIELIVKHANFDQAAGTTLDKTLFGLGFHHTVRLSLANGYADGYAYELENYNKKRSWNSPENWANPQNFEKFRW